MSHLLPIQYNKIFRVSFLSIGSSIYAVHHKQYMLSLCPAGVFLTSINYWRKPEPSWRRNVDMSYVLFSLFYQMYKAYGSTYGIQYYTLTLIAGSMYPLATYYSRQKLYWHSTYAHCALHIIANVANLVLYSGKIE